MHTLRCRLFGSRQYKVSSVPPSPSLRPLSRAYHYHRRTLDGDKSCDRNDSAKLLLARIRARCLPCGSLHGRKSDAVGGTEGRRGLREEYGEGEKGTRPFPTIGRRRRGPGYRREAMSVTSGNYARVPVAIGLLILPGEVCRVPSVAATRPEQPAWRSRSGCGWE